MAESRYAKLEQLIFPRSIQMKDKFLLLAIKLQNILEQEDGQDLIEYALVVALIALGATAGMKTLANAINQAFDTVSTSLSSQVGS